jgi:putative ABC transport system permease protein
MNTWEGVRVAFAQIRAQKLKSFFAVIGVVIGVMFLITVVSVIEGMNRYMEDDFARKIYGLNTLVLRQRPQIQINTDVDLRREWNRRPRLTLVDAESIRDNLSMPLLISVETNSQGQVASEEGLEIGNALLTAATADIFRIRDLEMDRGRSFTAPEENAGSAVVVLGASASETLFGQLDPIGRRVRIRGDWFEVIGVMSRQGDIPGMPVSLNNRAITPVTSPLGRKMTPNRFVGSIIVRPVDGTQLDLARIELESLMRERHRLRPTQGNSFEIESAKDSLSFWETIRRMLMLAFPMLVGISLVVGGIVIMNIMLVSVIERTREIGLRKALGARRRDIHFQMLVEAATLSGAGALLGILLGLGLARLVAAVSPLPAAIAPFWMGVAALLGVSVGIIAGLYPATRAARLDPVVALQRE